MDNPQALYENSLNVARQNALVPRPPLVFHDRLELLPSFRNVPSRRSIGLSLSSLISATLRSWSCVSVYGKACSNSCCSIAAKRCFFGVVAACTFDESITAISSMWQTTLRFVFLSLPPNLLSFGAASDDTYFERA